MESSQKESDETCLPTEMIDEIEVRFTDDAKAG